MQNRFTEILSELKASLHRSIEITKRQNELTEQQKIFQPRTKITIIDFTKKSDLKSCNQEKVLNQQQEKTEFKGSDNKISVSH